MACIDGILAVGSLVASLLCTNASLLHHACTLQARLPISLTKRAIRFLAHTTFYISCLGLSPSAGLARSAMLSMICLAMAVALDLYHRRTFWAGMAKSQHLTSAWGVQEVALDHSIGGNSGAGGGFGIKNKYE